MEKNIHDRELAGENMEETRIMLRSLVQEPDPSATEDNISIKALKLYKELMI